MLLAVLVVLLVILPVPVVLDAGGIDIDITSWLKSGGSSRGRAHRAGDGDGCLCFDELFFILQLFF